MTATPDRADVPAGPLETPCGRVTATPPTAPDVYWRITFYQDGTRRQTTGGRTRSSAERKVKEILRQLDGTVGPNSSAKVGHALDRYLDQLQNSASPNHAEKTTPDLRRALEPYRNLASRDLASHQLRKACNESATKSAAEHRQSRLSAFLKWGHAEGYFSEPQTHLVTGYRWTRPKGAPVRPTRDFTAVRHGESTRFVTADQVPLHKNIATIGDALEAKLARRGKLMIEVAHSAGLRAGELYALADRAVDLSNRYVDVDWQILSLSSIQLRKYGMASRRDRPKGKKVRTTNFPAVTTTGFNLLDALGERLEQVDWEERHGRNPMRLLFPAPRGGWFWHTSFTNDYFHVAAEAAGWEFIRWQEGGRERKMLRHTFHTLRHRFARDRIDLMGYVASDLQVIGGWDSAQVMWERYYGISSDALRIADDKLRAWEAATTP